MPTTQTPDRYLLFRGQQSSPFFTTNDPDEVGDIAEGYSQKHNVPVHVYQLDATCIPCDCTDCKAAEQAVPDETEADKAEAKAPAEVAEPLNPSEFAEGILTVLKIKGALLDVVDLIKKLPRDNHKVVAIDNIILGLQEVKDEI